MNNTTHADFKKWLKDYQNLKHSYLLSNTLEIEKRSKILTLLDKHIAFFENILRDIVKENFPFYSELDIKIMQSTRLCFLSEVTVTYYFMNKKYCYRYTILFQDLERDIRELENQLRSLRYEGEIL